VRQIINTVIERLPIERLLEEKTPEKSKTKSEYLTTEQIIDKALTDATSSYKRPARLRRSLPLKSSIRNVDTLDVRVQRKSLEFKHRPNSSLNLERIAPPLSSQRLLPMRRLPISTLSDRRINTLARPDKDEVFSVDIWKTERLYNESMGRLKQHAKVPHI